MQVTLDFAHLVDLFTLFIGVLFGLLMIFGYPNRQSFCLGMFLLASVLKIVSILLAATGQFDKNPNLLFLPISFFYFTAPMLFIYAHRVTGYKNRLKFWRHLIPGMLEFLLFSVLFFLPSATKTQIFLSDYFMVYYVLSIVYRIFYSGLIIQYVDQYNQLVPEYYSDAASHSLAWLKRFSICYIILYLFALHLVLKSDTFAFPFKNLTFSIFFFLIHFAIVVRGISQAVPQVDEEGQLPSLGETTAELNERAAQPDMGSEVVLRESDFMVLKAHMDEHKPYISPDLTLSNLARQVGFQQRYLSQLIKKYTGHHFNRYVNGYRIELVQQMLLDPNYNNLSILGIAQEAGFHSKSSFYTTFQEIVGTSPSEYKETLVG